MSRQSRRRHHAAHRKHNSGELRQSHLRIVKAEFHRDDQTFVGDAMALAGDVCEADRPLPGNPGRLLRRAREARGLTLDDISRTTKINRKTLAALEAGDVLHLPARIYTRGFLKSYAREVGLDPDRTVDDYFRAIEPLTIAHLLADDGQLPPIAQATHATVDANDDMREILAVNQVRRFGWVTTAAAAIGLIVYVASFGDRAEREGSTSGVLPAAVATAAVPTADGDGEAATAQPIQTSGPLRVELVPEGPCWLAVSVDGEEVFSKLLQAGERRTLAIDQHAVMRVGDPGALTFSINGQAGRSLGPAGQPVNVVITKENFREFISS